MAVYTVHQPPAKGGKTADDPERFAFVRDGFHFWAFVFAPLWMIRRRLWLTLLLYLVIAGGLQVALNVLGASDGAQIAVFWLVNFLVGLEAGTLRRWTLTRRGWKNVGTVVGDDLEAAEHRFFAAWTERDLTPVEPQPVSAVPTVSAVTAAYQARRGLPNSDIVGLFPEPGAPR